jgi:hypothetical protein
MYLISDLIRDLEEIEKSMFKNIPINSTEEDQKDFYNFTIAVAINHCKEFTKQNKQPRKKNKMEEMVISNNRDSETYTKSFKDIDEAKNWVVNHLDLSKDWKVMSVKKIEGNQYRDVDFCFLSFCLFFIVRQ